MNKFLIASMAVTLSMLITNCGENQSESRGEVVTSQFLDIYAGNFSEQDGKESFSIQKDGSISIRKNRQVGFEDSATVPYPTVCTYTLEGLISSVIKLNDNYRTRVDSKTGKSYLDPGTHSLEFAVSKVTWEKQADVGNPESAACQAFQDERNGSTLFYSYGIELLDNDTLRLHTSGGGDYVGQAERTESTLDEVFKRQ